MKAIFILITILMLRTDIFCQNIVDNDELDLKLPEVKLGVDDLMKVIANLPTKCGKIPEFKEAKRVARKLDDHTREMLQNMPLMPFHHTLGISGYEVYFNHPDVVFYTLSISLPFLSKDTRRMVEMYLEQEANVLPPYSIEGYDNRTGNARESYDVPMNLRIQGNGRARNAFGVYAFWSWYYFTENTNAMKIHWNSIKERIKPLLVKPYGFDIYRTDYSKDEAENLNGDLAGLIGFIRLAQINNDDIIALTNAQAKALELLNLRVNLERVNPKILTKTSATKSLHIYKLARYCSMVPEIAFALKEYGGGCAEKRLNAFREARNGWYIAFADRFIGGENYTNPLHFGRALFSGAALIEKLHPDTLAKYIDVPHCRGDLYFIEKCALTLRAFCESIPEK